MISQAVAQPGRWYSVAVTKTPAQLSIYVNGILERGSALGPFFDINSCDPPGLRAGARRERCL